MTICLREGKCRVTAEADLKSCHLLGIDIVNTWPQAHSMSSKWTLMSGKESKVRWAGDVRHIARMPNLHILAPCQWCAHPDSPRLSNGSELRAPQLDNAMLVNSRILDNSRSMLLVSSPLYLKLIDRICGPWSWGAHLDSTVVELWTVFHEHWFGAWTSVYRVYQWECWQANKHMDRHTDGQTLSSALSLCFMKASRSINIFHLVEFLRAGPLPYTQGWIPWPLCLLYTLPKVQSSQHRFFCWKGCLKISFAKTRPTLLQKAEGSGYPSPCYSKLLRECSFNIGGWGMGRNCDKFRNFS